MSHEDHPQADRFGDGDRQQGRLERAAGCSIEELGNYFSSVVGPPEPGESLAALQREWDAIEALREAPPADLPRPWEISACKGQALHVDLMHWLARFVDWLNDQHAWDPEDRVPSCWAQHPHLVHDLAVIADCRRRAGQDVTSAALEQWHRITLSAFHERRRHSMRQHCAAGHRTMLLI